MSVYSIQMNQDGAILKTSKTAKESFLVMPDYIKLEKASYPRMIVNPIEPWTEEDPPPEDYGKNVIDDTFEEDWYYTFYCDSVEWDGDEATLDKSGNGSKENPWRNFWHAMTTIHDYVTHTCCSQNFRVIVRGIVKDVAPSTFTGMLYDINFKWRVIVDFSDAEISDTEDKLTKKAMDYFSYLFIVGMNYKLNNACHLYHYKLYNSRVYGDGDLYISYSTLYEVEFDCNVISIHNYSYGTKLKIKGKGEVSCYEGVLSNCTVYGCLESENAILIDCICHGIQHYGNHEYDIPKYSYRCEFDITNHLDDKFKIYDELGISGMCYIYDTTLSITAIVDVYVDNIIAIRSISDADYHSPFFCNCKIYTNIMYNYSIGKTQYSFYAYGILLAQGVLKDCLIAIQGDLPQITSSSSSRAYMCPLYRNHNSGAVLMNCQLQGFKSIGKVPENACNL